MHISTSYIKKKYYSDYGNTKITNQTRCKKININDQAVWMIEKLLKRLNKHLFEVDYIVANYELTGL